MNYLFRYLCLLNAEERALVGRLSVSDRERQVLETLFDLRSSDKPSKADALARLAISGTHFDKICSVLLDKVYAAVVPEGGTALLYDLNRRDLYGLFCHQMKKQEKALVLSNAPAEERAEFYLACLTMLQRICRRDYDDDLMRELGRKYLACKPGATAGDELFIVACRISAYILNTAARGMQNRLADEIESQLQELDAVVAGVDEGEHTYAHYHYCRAWSGFYTYIDSRPARRLDYLERMAALTERYPHIISEEDRVLALSRIAEARYNNSEFTVAATLYSRLFAGHPAVLAREYYHTTKYSQVLIILGRYDEAERLIDERFGVFVDNREAALTTMASLSYAKLYLCSGQYDRAKEYIDLGFGLIAKNVYIQYEIELRLLEAAYFYLSGDEEFAETLAEKHIKYLQAKGFPLRKSKYYPWFLVLMQAFTAERAGVKKLSKKLEQKLEEFGHGPAKIYGILLETMRAREQRRNTAAMSG